MTTETNSTKTNVISIDFLIEKIKQDCSNKNFESIIVIGTAEDGSLYSLKAGNIVPKKVLWYARLLERMWCQDVHS